MANKIHLMTTSSLEETIGELSKSDQLLWNELIVRNVEGTCFTPNEAEVLFSKDSRKIVVRGETLDTKGVLIVRLTRGALERTYEIAKVFESLGGKVTDPVETLIYPGGKLLPYIKRQGKINFVTTYFFNKNSVKIENILKQVTFPFIIKPQKGFQGKGVVLVHNQIECEQYINESEEENLMAQDYISDIVDEFRVIVIGGEGLGVARKIGEALIKNTSQGTDFESVEDAEVLAFAEQASLLENTDVYGTDVVRTKSGKLYLIENNRCPNFTTFREATKIKVEEKIIDFTLRD